MTDHAEDVAREHEEGRAKARGQRDEKTKWAQRIAAILALAEDAAKRGDEKACQEHLDKAAALQLQYAIDDAMLPKGDNAREEIVSADFCTESNTPLIKAKRELVNGLAMLYRGKAVMMSEMQPRADGKGLKLNRRAKVRVWAHESDLSFIQQMYTSMILQMQTMMAADERQKLEYGIPSGPQGAPRTRNAWRVSYAYAYVRRVYSRLSEAKRQQEWQANAGTPGTALVLADRTALVKSHVDGQFGNLRSSRYREDNDGSGTAAGHAAANRADLGQRKVQADSTRRIGT